MVKSAAVAVVSVCALFLVMSCGSTNTFVKQTVDETDPKLAEKIGEYHVYVGTFPDEEMFQRHIKVIKEATLSDTKVTEDEKNARLALYDGLAFQPGMYGWWTLRYHKQFSRKENDVQISIVDAAGNKAGKVYYGESSKVSESGSVQGTYGPKYFSEQYYDIRFYFVLDFPVTKELAQRDRLPITVTGRFLENQKVAHELSIAD